MSIFWKKRRKKAGSSGEAWINVDLGSIKVTCSKCKNEYSGNDIWHKYYICPNCGYENSEGMKFCNECGTKLGQQKTFCTSCGAELQGGARFCGECGARQG